MAVLTRKFETMPDTVCLCSRLCIGRPKSHLFFSLDAISDQKCMYIGLAQFGLCKTAQDNCIKEKEKELFRTR